VHEWLTVDAADVSELRVLTLDDNPVSIFFYNPSYGQFK
jgi:hypothetical protein